MLFRSGNNPGNLFDQVQTPEKLASLLTDTDILIISLPGTKETFHLISTPQLSRLPDHAVIINVGRGTVVDQEALEEELQNGRLYAGLDVFEKEPLPAESVLWDSQRAVITPHVAGDTSLPHTVDRIVDLFLEETVHTRSPTFLNYLNSLLFNTLYQENQFPEKNICTISIL